MTAVANTPQAWTERAQTAPSSHEAALSGEYGQTQRFLAVLKHLRLRSGDSLLDYGCGTGRFSAFLPADVHYHGYDPAGGMVTRAREEHPRRTFTGTLPEGPFDQVAAIGVWNLPGEYPLPAIQRLWDMTARTLVVSVYRGTDTRNLSRDPALFVNAAKTLSDFYTLDCSYLPNDFVLALHRR